MDYEQRYVPLDVLERRLPATKVLDSNLLLETAATSNNRAELVPPHSQEWMAGKSGEGITDLGLDLLWCV